MPQILKINPQQPVNELIYGCVLLLRAGKVVAFLTETFYGLAVDASNADAVDRIFQIKGRSFKSPIALIAGSKNGVGGLVAQIPATAQRLMQVFWPGPLTLLFPAPPQISPRLTAGTGKIGIRVSSHPIADSLANGLGGSITATSANLSGAAECLTAAEVLAALGDRIDLIIDGGPSAGGKGSTVLDMTVDPPACLREGAISFSLIQDSLKQDKPDLKEPSEEKSV